MEDETEPLEDFDDDIDLSADFEQAAEVLLSVDLSSVDGEGVEIEETTSTLFEFEGFEVVLEGSRWLLVPEGGDTIVLEDPDAGITFKDDWVSAPGPGSLRFDVAELAELKSFLENEKKDVRVR